MSARGIREYDGKRLVGGSLEALQHGFVAPCRVAQVLLDLSSSVLTKSSSSSNGDVNSEVGQYLDKVFCRLESEHSWLLSTQLVVKPDQLIKRRGKAGLVLLDADWITAKSWIWERALSTIEADGVSGVLKSFVIEPFVPHGSHEEYYLCIRGTRDGDEILFCPEGGVNVGDVDAKAARMMISDSANGYQALNCQAVEEALFGPLVSGSPNASPAVPEHKAHVLSSFVVSLYASYVKLHFTYLEINPLVLVGEQVYVLDMAAKVDQTAEFECRNDWIKCLGPEGLAFPAPFGRELTAEEAYIANLDASTGASLKLTVLNMQGRVWTMVAGGGASVAYADAIAAMGYAHEMANYGEYSGAPSETQTYEYARTIIDLMTREYRDEGKVLFIGGGIANFTNVAATFKGIVRALQEAKDRLQAHKVSVYVRRGGPNYQEGLRMMRDLGESLGVPIAVFGPETHITAIVPMALGSTDRSDGASINGASGAISSVSGAAQSEQSLFDQFSLQSSSPAPGALGTSRPASTASLSQQVQQQQQQVQFSGGLFHQKTRSFVYGMQRRAVQGMMDFDYICQRSEPSVAAIIYPFGGDHSMKFYWGTNEVMVPVFAKLEDACRLHPEVDVLVNFASHRSVLDSVMETLEKATQIRTIAIIAEGVPERHARRIKAAAKDCNVSIIGPATVGGLRAGSFKIGNTGGMIDNIISSRLYRAGSVSYVSKSGGMSNELNNTIARCADGVLEGIAIGGDRYPGSTFVDHLMRFEADPQCKMIVLLGEVGGVEEYAVCEALSSGKITKPVIAWCIGVCAGSFSTEVQFGHAGAMASSQQETALAKNSSLASAGAIVPSSFEALPDAIAACYEKLVSDGILIPVIESGPPRRVPIDYAWAQELGLVRKPAQFVSSICDDRGQELLYAGMPISAVFEEEIGVGGVLSLLWFRRRLPQWATKFVEMVLMLTADHGPAVSGAHNTIVAARAGKDLVSSLASGLLTIGERFGGALDGAAEQFTAAFDAMMSPQDFVTSMRKKHQLIMGIGHRIKSKTNPDLRVKILIDYAHEHFPCTSLLDYALQVEAITTQKKDNLILNVDGATAVLFVDLLRHSGAFTRSEADEYVKIGALNGLFVLGRSLGFIGHYLDQRRLKQGLYRHPWDDISYISPGQARYEN